MLSWITDMELVQTGSGLRLYTATRAGGGVLVLGLEAAGLVLLDQVAVPSGATLPAPAQLDVVMLDGQQTLLLAGGNGARLAGYQIAANGNLGALTQIIGSPSGTVAAEIMVQVAGETYGYVNILGDAALRQYHLLANGQMVFQDSLITQGGFQGVDIAAFSSVSFGGVSYLLALSTGQDALRSYRIAADGALTQVASLGAAGGLGLAAPSALEVVHLAGGTYALVAGAGGGSSSISVVQIGANGRLGLTDHVVDTLDTRFQGIEALATARVGDRVFVLAGGGDDGLTLLTLLPNGRLLQLAEQLQAPGMALHNISEMTATVVDGKIILFVAGQGLGITELVVDPGDLAAMTLGSDGVDTLQGGTADDLLSGRADDDLLQGGAGDDILMDGAGSDILYGGAGADIFVLSGDGTEDTIRDFQLGVDRLDLSAWGRVYATDALSFRNYPFGIIINFGDERLVIQSSNNQRIPASAFLASELFGLWHVVAEPVVEGVRVEGSPRQDVLTGDLGDDTFAGGGGADVIDGGAGFDYIDFTGTAAELMLDLTFAAGNGGAAAGDHYISVEAAIGGAGDDVIRGSAGANVLRGAAGHDQLFGRGGNDALSGGVGDDTLEGGAGADRLFGGAGRNLAQYTQATGAVTVDLQAPLGNQGEAKGDIFEDIQDLAGGRFADILRGDGVGNLLSGLAGDDLLQGRNGNDSLFGGDGQDHLQGDGGDDQLLGGAGVDTALFAGALAVRVDLALHGVQNTGYGLDLLLGIENLLTGAGADHLTGDDKANHLTAGAGNDTLLGGAGGDWLLGGAGNDEMRGGAGMDWVVFEGAAAIAVNLARSGAQITGQGFDVIAEVECVFSGAGADRIGGTSQINILFGNDGNDWIAGGAGGDSLHGGAGQDTVWGGQGNDAIWGGAGVDLAGFAGGKVAATVHLGYRGAQNTGSGYDTLSGIENLVTGAGADRLWGNAEANALYSGAGADFVAGGGGDDRLTAGAGADTLAGGTGQDWLSGGAGADRFVFTSGRDVIHDFHRAQGDKLALDDAVLRAVRGMTAQQVVSSFGHDLGDKVLLDFGHGNSLTLEGVSSLHTLAQVLIII